MTMTRSTTATTPGPVAGPSSRGGVDEDAVAHFTAKLAHEIDPSDVHTALAAGAPLVLVDCRGEAAWRQGRIPSAVHLPTADIPARARDLLPVGTEVVVHCWGPGCNGATKAALALARLGFPVREMIGGYEYWAREGLPTTSEDGETTTAPDPLTAPVVAITCEC